MSDFLKKPAQCILTSQLAKHGRSGIYLELSSKNRDISTQLAIFNKKVMLERERLDDLINDCINKL